MNIFESIILGVIQGLTEFLPISSSGHLVLAQHFLGIKMEGILFEIVLHLGTLVAILIYYKKELKELIIESINGNINKRKYMFYLFISSLPIGFVGFFYGDFIELFFIPSIVSITLFINGMILAFTFFISRKSVRELTFLISLLIGITQVFALIPGISRSGITISTAVLLGVIHGDAAKFSFFLAIPGLIGAGFLQIFNTDIVNNISLINLIIGFISSVLVGYFMIELLLNLISKGKFYYFSFYCIFLSIISYAYLN